MKQLFACVGIWWALLVSHHPSKRSWSEFGDTCSHDVSWISARVAICACTRTDGTLTRSRACINLIRSCTRTGLTLYLYLVLVSYYIIPWSRTGLVPMCTRTCFVLTCTRTCLLLMFVHIEYLIRQHDDVSWVVTVFSCSLCFSYRILRHQSAIIILTITTITTYTTTASPEPE